MAKVKFDVSGVDPEDSAGVTGEQAPVGVYPAKIRSCEAGYAKGENGQPDKSRPMLIVEVSLLKPNGKPAAYYPVRDYVSFSDAAQWKLDQFLQAVGIASRNKRSGSFDTAKIVNKKLKIRIKGDTYNGEYQARVGTYLVGTEDADEDLLEDDELEEEDWDEELDEDEAADFDDDSDEDAEDAEEDSYSLADLEEMSIKEVRGIFAEYELDMPKTRSKAKLIQALDDEGLVVGAEDDEEELDEEDPF